MELAHVVMAMVDTKPKRVMCKTCRSEHAYRKGGGAPGPSRKRSPSSPRVPKTVILASELWQKRLDERKSGEPIPYVPTHLFAKGDCLNHPKFGLGCVEEVRLAGKIIVLFREGEKILIHSLPKPNAQ
ncbi:MAG: hypothetical protein HYR96_02280 [Deltaproteobacteria bacterium]|nr:hypothetical protein [Deltaproteobacteria bacterium]